MSFSKYFNEYQDIVSSLISFNTISSTSVNDDMPNTNLIDYIDNFFKTKGFFTKRFLVAKGKENLYVTNKLSDGGLMLSGHTDTVGCKIDKWQSYPFTLDFRDGRLYGLGRTDMKGYLALIMLFLTKCEIKDSDRPLSALFTCDEETDMKGAIDYAQNAEYRPNLILIGESTDNKAVIAHKGYMAFSLDIKGKACHSSNPSLGINAIEGASLAIKALQDFKDTLNSFKDIRFQIPAPSLNLGVIKGGNGSNIVCDHVKIEFDLRPMPQYPCARAFDDLKELEHRLNNTSHCSFKLARLYDDVDPFLCADDKIIDDLEKITHSKGLCVNYATEASHLSKIAPTVVLGPGSIDYAHSIDESIAFLDLKRAYDDLVKIYKSICIDKIV